MRLRNDPLAGEKLAAFPRLIVDENSPRPWREVFGQEQPLCLEIGMGRGRFLVAMTAAHPDWNFVAIDLRRELLYETALKLTDACPNGRLLLLNGEELGNWFGEGELERIYINFPDPWPKNSHVKRRLTHRRFLLLYARLLRAGGAVYFRTDQEPLFDHLLDELAALTDRSLRAEIVCRDYHNSPYFNDGIMTEYEEKKSRLAPICYACLRKE